MTIRHDDYASYAFARIADVCESAFGSGDITIKCKRTKAAFNVEVWCKGQEVWTTSAPSLLDAFDAVYTGILDYLQEDADIKADIELAHRESIDYWSRGDV